MYGWTVGCSQESGSVIHVGWLALEAYWGLCRGHEWSPLHGILHTWLQSEPCHRQQFKEKVLCCQAGWLWLEIRRQWTSAGLLLEALLPGLCRHGSAIIICALLSEAPRWCFREAKSFGHSKTLWLCTITVTSCATTVLPSRLLLLPAVGTSLALPRGIV